MGTVKNSDVAGLQHRIVIFDNELGKSVSASVAGFRDPDKIRLQSYIDNLISYKSWIVSADPVDAPAWHVKEIPYLELAELPDTLENPSLLDAKRMLQLISTELIKGQSKDLPAGLSPYCSKRFDDQVARLQSFLSDYVNQQTNPLDLPEASAEEG